MSKIALINGPNLNLLGQREPEIYGSETLADVEQKLQQQATELGHQVVCFQSNHEGAIVDFIQQCRQDVRGIIINPAAYSHSSIAILDGLNSFDGAVIEVHISNIHARESFRHHSYVSKRANGIIMGCGILGYNLAMQQMDDLLS